MYNILTFLLIIFKIHSNREIVSSRKVYVKIQNKIDMLSAKGIVLESLKSIGQF